MKVVFSAFFIGKIMHISWTLETKGEQSDKTEAWFLKKSLTLTPEQVS